ncbi:hypothetical protein [Streptomyces sp. NBC_01190]|uniref:hypothetical protein n=1 Tax=Streptomyces sp. NBC_01190 TaxID=2903767 RepID=UPI0038641D31|nr:hypothetical protein OG519_33930 [Streptomyces sp. NBC_01190]
MARTLGPAVGAALAWFTLSGGVTAAPHHSADAGVTVADAAPGYAVEDFGYPGADEILADQGITLKRGDGHIVLADCASGGELVEVKALPDVTNTVCFRVLGDGGWLSVEMPSVYSVRGNDYDTQVSLTTDGEERTWDIDKGLWTSVGESADDQGREWVLTEITVTR